MFAFTNKQREMRKFRLKTLMGIVCQKHIEQVKILMKTMLPVDCGHNEYYWPLTRACRDLWID